jgi:Txe/YoeB family toxin of Txe-Axe toxin-antitoxin module
MDFVYGPSLILLGGTSTNVVYLIGLGLLISVTVWILSTLIDRVLKKFVKGNRMKKEIARELKKIVSDVTPKFSIIPESESMRRPSSDKWSRKQILGHLIDSASNNHQRFIRGQMSSEIKMGGYEQDRWVTCQDYQNENWLDIVQLWNFYNLHLAHVITCVPEACLKNICFIGENEPVTLEYLIQDYLRHLKHHIDQILAGW